MATRFTTRIDTPQRPFARPVPPASSKAPSASIDGGNGNDARPVDPLVHTLDSLDFAELRELLEQASEQEDTLFRCMSRFCQLACQATNGLACLIVRIDAKQSVGESRSADDAAASQGDLPWSVKVLAEHNALVDSNRGLKQEVLRAAATDAVARHKTLLIDDGPIAFLAVPVGKAKDSPRDCLSLALHLGDQPREPFLAMLHLVATYVERWHHRQLQASMIRQAESIAAAAELLADTTRAENTDEADCLLVNQLAQHLGARAVVFARPRSTRSRRVRLTAVSNRSTIDPRGELSSLMRDTMEEAMIRQDAACVPEESGAILTRAHERLHREMNGCSILTQPIETRSGSGSAAKRTRVLAGRQGPVGVLLCIVEPAAAPSARRFLAATQSLLADGLRVVERADRTLLQSLRDTVVRLFTNHRLWLGAVAVLAFAGLCCFPVPHRIRCEASLAPLERAVAVAPFDGILHEALVAPGELVEAGQVLAILDDRELRLELDDASAECSRLHKKRDVYQSERNAAAVAMTTLEIEKIDSRIALLESRLTQLEISSRLRGLVLTGDLEALQDAPVRTGEMLYEVAPIEQLRIDINLPEESLRFVKPEQTLSLLLDGFPHDPQTARIDKVRPASTVLNGQNVFVCEAQLDNNALLFRPGMQALVKIDAGQRALGWVLFHRAWERTLALMY